MKKQYIFLILIFIILNLLYHIGKYKYAEYRVFQYTEEIITINERYETAIEKAQSTLDRISTRAYKNKIAKSELLQKNPAEEVIFLISEDRYNTFTSTGSTEVIVSQLQTSQQQTESLIASMSNYEKWVYLIFGKDIR